MGIFTLVLASPQMSYADDDNEMTAQMFLDKHCDGTPIPTRTEVWIEPEVIDLETGKGPCAGKVAECTLNLEPYADVETNNCSSTDLEFGSVQISFEGGNELDLEPDDSSGTCNLVIGGLSVSNNGEKKNELEIDNCDINNFR